VLDPEVLRELEAGLDRVMERFADDHTVVFGSDAERLRELHSGLEEGAARWARSHECAFPGCSAPSISRSHTIQKEGPLRSVSKGGKVLTPRRSRQTGQIELALVGLSKASVFPGFCPEHERLFQEFERDGGLQTERDVLLQLYRTACREQFRLEHTVWSLERLISRYEGIRDQGLATLLERELGTDWMHRNDIRPRSITGEDGRTTRAREFLADARVALETVDSGLRQQLEAAIRDGQTDVAGCLAFQVDVCFPIALSGLGSFYVSEAGRHRRILALLGVFPDCIGNSTMLTICAPPSDSPAVDLYLSSLESALGLLNMVEQWMIRGTDHWFLHPDAWAAKPDGARQAILDSIEDGSAGIDAPLDFSILDGMRRDMLPMARRNGYTDLAKQEAAKLVRSF